MIPKSGRRFSEKIMLQQYASAGAGVVLLAGARRRRLREYGSDRGERNLLILERLYAGNPDRTNQLAIDDDRQPALRRQEREGRIGLVRAFDPPLPYRAGAACHRGCGGFGDGNLVVARARSVHSV